MSLPNYFEIGKELRHFWILIAIAIQIPTDIMYTSWIHNIISRLY